MKNKIITIISILLILVIITISISTRAQATDNGTIDMNINVENLEEGHVAIEILLRDQTQGISAFSGYFHFDEEIFEAINSNDIKVKVDEEEIDTITFTEKTNKISIYFIKDINDIGVICTIDLKVKEEVDLSTINKLSFLLGTMETYSFENDNVVNYDSIQKDIGLDGEPINPTDELYLLSDTLKIGETNINKYEAGDKYISRVSKETTKQGLMEQLKTNGTIKILKADGTELAENEFIGTGMTLEVEKDEEKISLIIAVMGDLNGDGKVTATDLSTLNQTILKLVNLENEYYIAADLDESKEITATDLSTENKMFLKIL